MSIAHDSYAYTKTQKKSQDLVPFPWERAIASEPYSFAQLIKVMARDPLNSLK